MKNVKFLFILSLMGALSSCEWHADLYNRYADENGIAVKCGLCDGKLLDETGVCSGEWRPLEMIDLGNGYYIRKLEDDKYVCGAYNDVIKSSIPGNCDDELINRFHDDSKYSLCRGGSVCVTNESDDYIFASCNTCGQDLVRCEISAEDETEQPNPQETDDKTEQPETQNSDEDKDLTNSQIIDEKTGKKYQCVSLNDNAEHCGSCNHPCNDGEFCQDGVCVTTGEKDNCGEGIQTCYCTVDNEGNYVECFDESDSERTLVCLFNDGRNTCGLTQCSEIPHGGCKNSEQCLLDKTDNKYKCGCAEGFVAYNHNCYNPYSTSSCGITETNTDIVTCTTDMICNGKECVCDHNYENCDNKCISVIDNKENCGGCHKSCDDNEKCEGRTCVCQEGFAKCDWESCVANDENHCGARGTCNVSDSNSENFKGFVCGENEKCESDECKCIEGTSELKANGVTKCRDTENDNDCCGKSCEACVHNIGDTCGPCDVVNGQTCVDGVCTVLDCEIGKINCNGVCRSTEEEHVIDLGDSGCVCADGWCAKDNNVANGCTEELNILMHCGDCNTACDSGYTVCDDGKCQCNANETECKNPKNEDEVICVDFENDNKYHMTSCGVCEEGWSRNDNDDWHDGCLHDLSSDVNNCGTPDHKCSDEILNAEPVCMHGVCNYISCHENYGNCDNIEMNGCEINLINTKEHCGKCNADYDYACHENGKCEILCETGNLCFIGGLDFDENSKVTDGTIDCCMNYGLYKYDRNKKYHTNFLFIEYEHKCDSHTHYGCYTEASLAELEQHECWTLQASSTSN